jgi:putative FmdB family regulatory protein
MPLYEYACRKCEHTFEALVYDGEAVACPQCHGRRLERLLSVPAKPRAEASSLPMSCNSDGPSCGAPWCRKK